MIDASSELPIDSNQPPSGSSGQEASVDNNTEEIRNRMRPVLNEIEKLNTEVDGSFAMSYGTGDHKIYVFPDSHLRGADAAGSVTWTSEEYLVATPDGFRIIDIGRNDGGFEFQRLFGEEKERRKLQGLREEPNADQQGWVNCPYPGGIGAALGSQEDDWRKRLTVGLNGWSHNGNFTRKGVRLLFANQEQVEEMLGKSKKRIEPTLEAKREAQKVILPPEQRLAAVDAGMSILK